MFSKKTCKRCGRKTKNSNSFCPTCGTPLNKTQRKEDFGMIGEDDSFDEVEALSNSIFGGMGGLGGGFKDTGLKYLFVSYDTAYTPDFLSFEGVTTNFKKDPNLRERQGLTIEDYVSRLYE